MNIPAESFDAILSDFVIHDIPAVERPGIVKHWACVLKTNGKVFLREPVGSEGIPTAELCRLMQTNGLTEVASRLAQVPIMGETFEGEFHKAQ